MWERRVHPLQSKARACRKVGVVYQWDCINCLAVGKKAGYLGETARSLWDRTGEHLTALRDRKPESAFWKHQVNVHGGLGEPKFTIKVLGKYKTAAERQVREALLINNNRFDYLLNSKAEYGSNAVARQIVSYGDKILEEKKEEVELGEQQRDRDPDNIINTRQTINREGLPPFMSQYSQRVKVKRQESAAKKRQGNCETYPPVIFPNHDVRPVKKRKD